MQKDKSLYGIIKKGEKGNEKELEETCYCGIDSRATFKRDKSCGKI